MSDAVLILATGYDSATFYTRSWAHRLRDDLLRRKYVCFLFEAESLCPAGYTDNCQSSIAEREHTLFRPKGREVENIDNPFGPDSFDVDCFGQGEAARISVEAQTNPLALLNYLDSFVDLDEALAAEEETREQLLTLQTEIEKAEQNVQLIPQYERLLTTTQQQLAKSNRTDTAYHLFRSGPEIKRVHRR